MDWPHVERLIAAFNARQATEPVPWSRERTMPLLMEIMRSV